MPDQIEDAQPFIDVDEWRDAPRRHRYVHGGFTGTHTLFSFYFPPAELYRGRFFQFLEGGAGGHEVLLAAGGAVGESFWAFDFAFEEYGGYLAESNQGHFPGEGTGFTNDYELYGASAQTAVYGRQLAAEMYGTEPHHGYIWGISGGGARSGFCLENRPDVWQGGAPHAGIGQSSQWSPWALTWLTARQKFAEIIDAAEPGGSGNPFAVLSSPQRQALADLYRRGWPRGAETQLAPFTAWAFPMYATLDADPGYLRAFWTEPGYKGADDPESLREVTVHQRATVKRIVPATEVDNLFAQMHVRLATAGAAASDASWGAELDIDDPDRLFMATVRIKTGEAAGRELLVASVDDGVLSPFSERTPEVFEGVEAGDEVEIDNRDFVAWCFYHWYSVEDPGRAGELFDSCLAPWTVDGTPIHPQRLIEPVSAAAPTRYRARLESKMIYVSPTHDAQVWPTTIFPYDARLRANLGDRLDDHYRLWFVENSPHGNPRVLGPALNAEKDPGVWSTRLVPYEGVTAQALREVVAWVEDDVAPRFCHGYRLTADNALELAGTAAERGGVQPVVRARVNGGVRADVRVGETVTFDGAAEQPEGAGTIIRAEWDFDGRGTWPVSHPEVDGSSPAVTVATAHAYGAPGTYFPALLVSAHVQGKDGTGPAIQNLARLRVVVRP